MYICKVQYNEIESERARAREGEREREREVLCVMLVVWIRPV